MPDETKTDVVARRRSGEGHLFLNRAKLAAQKIRTEAASKKAAAIAAAHTEAQATFADARAKALGMSLEKIMVLAWINDMMHSRNSGLHLIEYAPDGSMLHSPVLVPAYMNFNMGAVDQGAQRFYFAASGASGREEVFGDFRTRTNAIGYVSLTDYSVGTLVEFPGMTRGTLAFDPEDRKLYVPNASGGIYVINLADNSFSEIGPFGQFGPIEFMLRDAIAVDPLHQKIYCMLWPINPAEEPENNFLIINYDGSDARKVTIPNGQIGPDNRNLSLDVDPVAGFIYGHSMSSLWRAPLDLSSVTIIGSLPQMEGMVLDRASHLLYCSKYVSDPQTGVHRSIYRSTTDGDLQPQRMCDLQLPYPLRFGNVLSISLLTMSGEARDKVLFEKSRKAVAPGIAAKKVADAHPEADKIRQIAHGQLEDAHKTAEDTINKKKSEAAEQRLTAQNDAREKAEQAAAKKEKALADAEAKKKKAHEDADAQLAQKQAEANDITGPAKANLDAKRRELQNS